MTYSGVFPVSPSTLNCAMSDLSYRGPGKYFMIQKSRKKKEHFRDYTQFNLEVIFEFSKLLDV